MIASVRPHSLWVRACASQIKEASGPRLNKHTPGVRRAAVALETLLSGKGMNQNEGNK